MFTAAITMETVLHRIDIKRGGAFIVEGAKTLEMSTGSVEADASGKIVCQRYGLPDFIYNVGRDQKDTPDTRIPGQ